MFACPKCGVDRSHVPPTDPCPECGHLLPPPAKVRTPPRTAAPDEKTEPPELIRPDAAPAFPPPPPAPTPAPESEGEGEAESESEAGGEGEAEGAPAPAPESAPAPAPAPAPESESESESAPAPAREDRASTEPEAAAESDTEVELISKPPAAKPAPEPPAAKPAPKPPAARPPAPKPPPAAKPAPKPPPAAKLPAAKLPAAKLPTAKPPAPKPPPAATPPAPTPPAPTPPPAGPAARQPSEQEVAASFERALAAIDGADATDDAAYTDEAGYPADGGYADAGAGGDAGYAVDPYGYGYGRAAPVRRVDDGPTGVEPPPVRDPARMAIGAIVVVVGAFLLLFYIPSKQPWIEIYDDQGQLVDTNRPERTFEWRFTEAQYTAAQVIAIGMIALGIVGVALGAVFRSQVEVRCRRCRRHVLAEKDGFRLRCTRARHTARLDLGTIALLAVLGALITAMMITIALGSVTRVH